MNRQYTGGRHDTTRDVLALFRNSPRHASPRKGLQPGEISVLSEQETLMVTTSRIVVVFLLWLGPSHRHRPVLRRSKCQGRNLRDL
jgi:hypothetical protein